MHKIPSQGVNGVPRGHEPCSSGSVKVSSESMYCQDQFGNLPQIRGNRWFRRMAVRVATLPVICFFLMLIFLLKPTAASPSSPQQPAFTDTLSRRAPNDSTPLLECLQVSPPVLSPDSCQQTLMVHTFGYSYGIPFVAQYSPPKCNFNRVTINFTVSSAGRQFDRLGHAWFNDTEIFRTSTAEPTRTGIIWTYTKDMSNFLSLFKEPQKLIFDLGNLVDDTYTGSWNTTLTANFFTAEDVGPADIILPVSAGKSTSDQPSQFVIPDVKATSALTLPQNTKKAVFSIAACGQATEEFWWANVLSSDTATFSNETTLYGYSPFRELQLHIDNTLAGVAWPFPVIFTGGIVPGFWRPVVGIDAFDLREDEIDITAFLPLLSDGKEHIFEIRIVGIDNVGNGTAQLSSTIGSNWPVSGKVFVWLDTEGSVTKGSAPTISAPEPALEVSSSVSKGDNGSVKALDYSVKASRKFSLSSTIKTSEGSKTVSWSQDLTFWLNGQLSNGGNDQSTSQSTTGKDTSTSDAYSKSYDYPLWVISSYNVLPDTNFTIDAKMGRGKYVTQVGSLAFPNAAETFDYSVPGSYKPSFTGTQINNWQNGTAHYLGAPALKKSFGSGSTEQLYSLKGISGPAASGTDLYRRHIVAVNDSVTYDQVVVGDSMQVSQGGFAPAAFGEKQTFAGVGIRAMLGRGPL
ncbi:hypothetical protein CC80DRAFT_286438 [Byssothecium circinans]|uniref:Peptide N-acetyl-beta-D-glucosaminyl asparaginase amidase A N-terminal domain-containing protein n=1 Tax=Byssothecium circinans TaxID=147558 RepID=A0A6A5U630_9PLEO|nr:hypothetical protein CC80DRAFT_286438 [Byssothecium circinans]